MMGRHRSRRAFGTAVKEEESAICFMEKVVVVVDLVTYQCGDSIDVDGLRNLLRLLCNPV